MYSRDILKTLSRYLKSFPVVVVTGARQVGKTTLLKENLKGFRYVSLEDPDQRRLALEDPRAFLERFIPPVIIDEFQYAPTLVSYIQTSVDQNRTRRGQYVLTGSQNFLMMEQVSQSLAGRAGILTLFGLSAHECKEMKAYRSDSTVSKALLRSSYPELWAHPKIQTNDWMGSYFQTYIERDVRNLAQVGDLIAFERFVRMCASHSGHILNLNNIATDTSIPLSTAQRWLSILQSTYILHLMPPFYANLSSRLRKRPKLYFADAGLAAYLIGFRDEATLINSPQKGALFETLVVSEFLKQSANSGQTREYYYLETKTGTGVDMLLKNKMKWDLYEVKCIQTVHASHFNQLKKTNLLLKDKVSSMNLICLSQESYKESGINIQNWTDVQF